MNFDSFFKEFFEANVGGPGAPFCASDKLSDLGFSVSDVEKLRKALNVQADVSVDIGVQDLKKVAGPGPFGEKKVLPAPRVAVATPENISGCGVRTEQLFLQFLRSLADPKSENLITRDMPISSLLNHLSEQSLSDALQKRWGVKASLPSRIEGMTIAG